MEVFQNLNEQGKTIILVTHEPMLLSFQTDTPFCDGQLENEESVDDPIQAEEASKWQRNLGGNITVMNIFENFKVLFRMFYPINSVLSLLC